MSGLKNLFNTLFKTPTTQSDAYKLLEHQFDLSDEVHNRIGNMYSSARNYVSDWYGQFDNPVANAVANVYNGFAKGFAPFNRSVLSGYNAYRNGMRTLLRWGVGGSTNANHTPQRPKDNYDTNYTSDKNPNLSTYSNYGSLKNYYDTNGGFSNNVLKRSLGKTHNPSTEITYANGGY